jgi:hypothetical protein
VGVPLVLHDGIFGETLRNGLAVTAVCGEVSGDGFWQLSDFVACFIFVSFSLLFCSALSNGGMFRRQ